MVLGAGNHLTCAGGPLCPRVWLVVVFLAEAVLLLAGTVFSRYYFRFWINCNVSEKNNVWFFNIRLKKIIFGNLIIKSKNIIFMKNNVWEFNIQLEKYNIRLKNNIQYSILKSKNLIFNKNNVWEFNIRELIFGKNTLIFLGLVINE